MKRAFAGGLALALASFVAGPAGAASIRYIATAYNGTIYYAAYQDGGSEELVRGDFLTVYDVGSRPTHLSGDLANSGLFSISTDLMDTPAPGTHPYDNPGITNIRFTYIGSSPLRDPVVGGFTLANPSDRTHLTFVDGSSHNYGMLQLSDLGHDVAPLLAPEPASLAVAGVGMLGLGIARRRRRK